MSAEHSELANEALFVAAKRAFLERDLAKAQHLCQQFATNHPVHAEARVLLANLAHVKGDNHGAESYLRQAIAMDANSMEALMGLAALLATEGDPTELFEICDRAVRLKPDLGAPHYHRARCLSRLGRFEEAIPCFERAALSMPRLAGAHYGLAVSLTEVGRLSKAVGEFRKTIELDPRSGAAYAKLGNLLLSTGDAKEAISCLRKAADLLPGRLEGILLLSRALIEERSFEEARELLEDARAAYADSAAVLLLLARLAIQMGRLEEAKKEIAEAMALDSRQVDAYSMLVATKRMDESDRPLMQRMLAITSEPTLPVQDRISLEHGLGKAFEDLGEYGQAIEHFHEANRLSKERLRASGKTFDLEERRQFVERSIERFTRTYIESAKGLPSDTPIFIVGMPRSGTTLLEQILSRHPMIGAAGELGTWSDIAAGPFQASERIPSEERILSIGKAYLSRLEQAAPGKRFITEKSPQNYLVLGPIAAVFPKARILHCARDPRDTCLSIYTTPFMAGPEYGHDLRELVLVHQQYARLMNHWRSVLAESKLMDVSYEDMVSSPESTIRRILGFLGLQWDEACLSHEQSDHAISTPSAWQARQPIYTGSVGRSRNYERFIGRWFGELR